VAKARWERLTVRPLLMDLGRDFRGGQHQALLLLQGLIARGHSPELVALRDSILALRARAIGVTVHGLNAHGRRVGAAMVVHQLVRGGKADVVHANESHALTAAWLARVHKKVPLLVSRRVIFALSSNSAALRRYRAAAQILAVSQCVKNVVIHAGLPPGSVTIIPVGVNIPPPPSMQGRLAARRKLGLTHEDAVLLGNVAAFTIEKGQPLLIRAFHSVRKQFPNCRMLLVGDGPERAKAQALVTQLQLDSAVHFAGFVDDVDTVYAAIDLFAFPGLADAMPTVLLAAMAHGLPVVGFALGGVPEALEDGENGLLVVEPEPKALAEAISRLLGSPADAKRMGEAARETIIARFSADHMVGQTIRAYEDAIAAGTVS